MKKVASFIHLIAHVVVVALLHSHRVPVRAVDRPPAQAQAVAAEVPLGVHGRRRRPLEVGVIRRTMDPWLSLSLSIVSTILFYALQESWIHTDGLGARQRAAVSATRAHPCREKETLLMHSS